MGYGVGGMDFGVWGYGFCWVTGFTIFGFEVLRSVSTSSMGTSKTVIQTHQIHNTCVSGFGTEAPPQRLTQSFRESPTSDLWYKDRVQEVHWEVPYK